MNEDIMETVKITRPKIERFVGGYMSDKEVQSASEEMDKSFLGIFNENPVK